MLQVLKCLGIYLLTLSCQHFQNGTPDIDIKISKISFVGKIYGKSITDKI